MLDYEKQFHLILTPFTFLEAIGYGKKLLQNIDSKIKKISTKYISDERHILFSKILEELNEKQFSDDIIWYYNNTLYNCCKTGKVVLEKQFGSIIDNKSFDDIFQTIAYDRTSFHYTNVQMDQNSKKKVFLNFCRDINDGIQNNVQYSPCRMLFYMFNDLLKQMKPNLSKNQISRMQNHIALKKFGDLIDIELAYYANLGNLKNNALESVICLTMDPVEKIKTRLFAIKLITQWFLNELELIYSKNSEKILKVIQPQSGDVICLDKELKVIEKISVSEIHEI